MTADPPRVGLFGLLGSGNIGNDASMEAMLNYLSADHPDAVVDAMCSGPARLKDFYRIEAIDLSWYRALAGSPSGIAAIAGKCLGKGMDVFRIAAWVRRHDVVIVPGMGVLETTLPVRALGTPFAIFVLCLSGRLLRTRVALVSVGANVIRQPLTRWLCTWSARLACYVSYRDAGSREAMRPGRYQTANVYPDLAFALPAMFDDPGDPQVVGVGVMNFHGTGDDRARADEIYESYVENLTSFILWLVDKGRRVLLYVGDTRGSDDDVIREILGRLRARRPALEPAQVRQAPASSFPELMAAMAPAAVIVATRYHNLVCALRLAKPTLSIGYAAKHDALMADLGMAGYCQHADGLDVDRLVEQFTELESRSAHVRLAIAERNAVLREQLAGQFAELSDQLFPAAGQDHLEEMTYEELH